MAYTDIDKPSDYFRSKLWTGNDATSRVITFDEDTNMQPDWVWVKGRSLSVSHLLQDSVRGTGGSYTLKSDATAGDGTNTQGNVSAFSTNGFTVAEGSDSDHTRAVNNGSATYVAWNWKAGTSFTNDASSTGIGTIDSTGSVNDTAGFSICSWVGTGSNGTIKHGLSTIPEIMIIKNTGHDTNWTVYTKPTGELGELRLNSTSAFVDDATLYNDTAPTSSVFSVGTNYNTNHSDGRTYIGYIFSSVKGYSKIGSWTGNGNADGPFIYTGFKPAWVMIKRTDSTNNWGIMDNKRSTFNEVGDQLMANTSDAEDNPTSGRDFLSNGFKLRETGNAINGSGASYIYMAFAENPFVTSSGVPATAR